MTTWASGSCEATGPKNTTESSSASLMPATPPAVRPWARTSSAENVSSLACAVMNTSWAESGAGPMPTTSSPSLRLMTSQSSRFSG